MKKFLLLLVLLAIASSCSNNRTYGTLVPDGNVNIRVENLSRVFFEEVNVCSMKFVNVGRRHTTEYVAVDSNNPIM